MILTIVIGVVCFTLGAIVSRIGVYVHQIETEVKLRNFANQVYEETVLSHDGNVSASWVLNQIDTIVNKEFR